MELVIIGGGPVGMWAALQYRFRHPTAEITVYEKRRDRTRKHTVHVDEYSTMLYNAIPLPLLEEMLGQTVSRNVFTSHEIQLFELERRLQRLLLASNVRLRRKEVKCIAQIEKRHPHGHHIVIADGRNSRFRRQYFGDDDKALITQDLQHVVKISEQTEVNLPDHTCKQVGPTEYLVFLRKDETEANLKLSPNVKTHAFTLQCYMARSCVKQYKRYQMYLLGDAAIGLPFFRSLNVGMINASLWAMHPEAYKTVQPLRGMWEMVKSNVKHTVFNLFMA